jgi:hypothetical protein
MFFMFSRFSTVEVQGVNSWYKPIKFALSIGIYSWTMGWIAHELGPGSHKAIISWVTTVALGIEIVYIAIQAAKGEMSHFNLSTPLYASMYNLMAILATAISLLTLYTALLFFAGSFSELPPSYLWAIRWGMLLFVIFSLQGFLMGSRLAHTVGAPDGGAGLTFLNWSIDHGDLRIAHFVGMHALQVLPLLGFYLIKDARWIHVTAAVYMMLAFWILWISLQGKSLLSI